jgi:ABC-type phosphate transport system substrate-binding protein
MPARRGGTTRGLDRPPLSLAARWLVLIALSLPCLASWADDPNDVVMIAHPNVRVETLSRDTARAIFAMRQRTWPNGQAASVFVLSEDHSVHARFSKSLLNVYPHQLRLAWDRIVFSGTGQAPNVVVSQPEMVKRVASTPGGLGYIERGYLDDSVNVIPLAN